MKILCLSLLILSLFSFMYLKPSQSLDINVTEEKLPDSLRYQFLIGDWDIKVSKYYVPAGGLKKEKTAWQHVEYKDNGKMNVDEWTGYDSKNKEKTLMESHLELFLMK